MCELVSMAAVAVAGLAFAVAVRRPRPIVSSPSPSPSRSPSRHRHAWEHRSSEDTNKRRREIYVCVSCGDREIRERSEP
jgi:hypothetical protein